MIGDEELIRDPGEEWFERFRRDEKGAYHVENHGRDK